MIGVLPAAPRLIDVKPVRGQQIGAIGRGAGGVKRGVLDQPDRLVCGAFGDGIGAGLHERKRLRVAGQPLRCDPFNHVAPVLLAIYLSSHSL